MKKKIIAFGASNSKHSINKSTIHKLEGVAIHILDLNDYQLPIYSVDLENRNGIPASAKDFLQLIKNSDGVIISVAEYNGLHTSDHGREPQQEIRNRTLKIPRIPKLKLIEL